MITATGDRRETKRRISDSCDICQRYDERFRTLKESDETQWKKIDELSRALSLGKNWIIGLLVAVILNLLTALVTAGIVITNLLK